LGALSIAIIVFTPRVLKKIPGSLLAIIFVTIIAYGGPDGKTELAEYPVNYDELDLSTLKSIDDVINDYEYGE
jgi:MFS superfamily sulfate permease-like transporter